MTTAIVPLAGRSSRFSAVTSAPKWSLHLGNKSILELSIESLSLSRLPVSHYVFVVLAQHVSLAEQLVHRSEVRSFEIVPVQETPDGQARSVELGLLMAEVRGEFIVWNGDTHLKQGWDDDFIPADRWMLLSKLLGSHWSFAMTKGRLVTETAEKVRISDLASLGLYGFADPIEFHDALEDFSGLGESYVAPLYNHIISRGLAVEAQVIESSYMVPLGTPGEVIDSCRDNKWPLPFELSSWSAGN